MAARRSCSVSCRWLAARRKDAYVLSRSPLFIDRLPLTVVVGRSVGALDVEKKLASNEAPGALPEVCQGTGHGLLAG